MPKVEKFTEEQRDWIVDHCGGLGEPDSWPYSPPFETMASGFMRLYHGFDMGDIAWDAISQRHGRYRLGKGKKMVPRTFRGRRRYSYSPALKRWVRHLKKREMTRIRESCLERGLSEEEARQKSSIDRWAYRRPFERLYIEVMRVYGREIRARLRKMYPETYLDYTKNYVWMCLMSTRKGSTKGKRKKV